MFEMPVVELYIDDSQHKITSVKKNYFLFMSSF